MAYDDDERSNRSGRPRELYRFEGTYVTYRYTSGSKAVSFQAPDETEPHTYLPITLDRSEVTAGTSEDDGLDLTVNLPIETELAQAYVFNNAPPSLLLTVWRYHDANNPVPYWRGRVTNLNIDESADGIVTLTSPSELSRAMNQEFPNVYYQSPCNHVLYDKRCKVPYAAWSSEVEVLGVKGSVIYVAVNAKLTGVLAAALVGGEFVLPSGERRMIVLQSAPQPATQSLAAHVALTVNFPFARINVGTEAVVAAGCNYAYSGDCAAKFKNQLNFGGFPFVGEDNLFETGADPGSRLPDNTCVYCADYGPWNMETIFFLTKEGEPAYPAPGNKHPAKLVVGPYEARVNVICVVHMLADDAWVINGAVVEDDFQTGDILGTLERGQTMTIEVLNTIRDQCKARGIAQAVEI